MLPNPRIVLFLATIVLSFASGWKVNSWKTDAAALDAAQEHAEQMRKSQEATDNLSAQLEAAKAKREVVTRTITKEVIRYAENPAIAHCVLPAEFGLLFDSAASGTSPASGEAADASGGTKDTSDATILEVATENFGQCREWRASLIGWQEWYQSVR